MSDVEEPPTKVTRYEMSSQYLEGEVEEDGQEEWLSEGLLTDDDTAEQDHSACNFDTSQDGTMASIDTSLEHLTDSQEATDFQNVSADSQTSGANGQNVGKSGKNDSVTEHSTSISGHSISISGHSISIGGRNVSTVKNASLGAQSVRSGVNVTTQGRNFVVDGTKANVSGHVPQDFEEELKNMEDSRHNQSDDFPEDLNAFLIRKKDGKIVTGNLKLVSGDDKQSDIEESPRHSDAESDGNDTDGLIRLLGDGGAKNKKRQDDDETADEEDFNLGGAKMKTSRVAHKASTKKYPASKAVPEDDDITDASSDEGEVMEKMFRRKVVQPSKASPSPAAGPKSATGQPKKMETSTPVKQHGSKRILRPRAARTPAQSVNTPAVAERTSLSGTTPKHPVTKATVTSGGKAPQGTKGPFQGIGINPNTEPVSGVQSFKLKTEPVSIVKSFKSKTEPVSIVKSFKSKTEPVSIVKSFKSKTEPVSSVKSVKSKTEPVSSVKSVKSKNEPDSNIVSIKLTTEPDSIAKSVKAKTEPVSNVKSFKLKTEPVTSIKSVKSKIEPVSNLVSVKLTEPDSSLKSVKPKSAPAKLKPEESDNDTPVKSVAKTKNQPMMKPEVMDEEMLSDTDSETDEESLYDELPSSEDEDLHEWFTLDVRAERAGDYIPLLGEKAEKLLLEEKQRVSTRLENLRKSLSALAETTREQADLLCTATAELAELDTQIKAA